MNQPGAQVMGEMEELIVSLAADVRTLRYENMLLTSKLAAAKLLVENEHTHDCMCKEVSQ